MKIRITLFSILAFFIATASPVFSDQVSSIVLQPNITGTQLRTQLNDINAAFNTLQKGATRPVTAVAGTAWLDDSGGSTLTLYLYDGTDDIAIGTFNTSSNTFTPAGQLGTFANAVVSKTGTHTLDSTDYGKLIKCDATSASFTSNISAASGLGTSWFTIIQKTDATSNTITVDPNSTEQVNGATTYVIRNQFEGVILIKDSTAFRALPFGNSGQVKVSSDDTTPGYIEDKVTAGNGIALSTASGGSNETRAVAVSLATDPGLEFNSGALRVKAGTGIVRNSSGVNVDVGTSANKIVQLNGSGQLPAVDGSLLTNLSGANRQVFTTSGTWNKPSGYSSDAMVLIEAWGGGGAGSSFASDGGNGGNSSFGSHVTAYGGEGGDSGTGSGNIGGGGGGFAAIGAGAAGGAQNFPGASDAYSAGGGGENGVGGASLYGGGGGSGLSGGATPVASYGGRGGYGSTLPTAPGGGSGTTGTGATGGGGGGYKAILLPLSALGSSETVTVGAGGTGGSGFAGARGEVRVTVF